MNRITISIFIYSMTLSLFATNYYVSSSMGKDTNDGLTENTSWQTLSNVQKESLSFVSGDVIAFRRGDEWNEFLSLRNVTNTIIFTAYGSGAKPIFHDRKIGVLVWTKISSNIWRNITVKSAPSRIDVEGTERLGGWNIQYSQLGTTVPDLVEWFWGDNGDGNDYFYFYSATDPNSFIFTYSNSTETFARTMLIINCSSLTFNNIDFRGGYDYSVSVYGCNNITFDNCEIGYLSERGIGLIYYNSIHNTNIEIKNCTFDTKFSFDYSNLGTYASAENTGAHDAIYVRSLKVGSFHNNTFKNWGHSSINISAVGVESCGYVAHDIEVYNNTIESTIAYGDRIVIDGNSFNNEIFRNIFTNSPTHTKITGYNNHFHHNIIKESRQSPLKKYKQAAFVLQGYAINCHDNIFENNLFINCSNAGFGIDGHHPSCNVENNIFRNNIVYNCGSSDNYLAVDLKVDEIGGYDAINNVFQNNIVYNSNSISTINYYDNSNRISVATFNTQTNKGNLIESNLSGNPAFVLSTDYHLTKNSPAINKGITPLSVKDYDENTIPKNGTLPDIGIYEYQF